MLKNKAKDTFFSKNHSLNCRGRLLKLDTPRVMGILNITPDSFYDGGRYDEPAAAVTRAHEMISEGADIIDLGAASSRPGAELVPPELEISRLEPVISAIRDEYPEIIISIDTYNASVAEKMINTFHADMINDISAGNLDPEMIPLISRLNVPYIIMHMKGTPGDMQNNPVYENVTDEVIQYFAERVYLLHDKGVSDVLIDPGFGFGKTMDQNYELLAQANTLQMFELPVVAGISRKSMIYNLLGSTREDALNGTTAAHMILLQKGVNIIRVHDVKEAREAVSIFNETRNRRD
ncbi:MAG: dihydropteroate synthase [Bacteroidales bacterium]